MNREPLDTAARLVAIERYLTRDLPPLMCIERTHGPTRSESCHRPAEFVVDTQLDGYVPLCRRCKDFYTGEAWTLRAADRLAFALAEFEERGA
jgi:hypothetical protein